VGAACVSTLLHTAARGPGRLLGQPVSPRWPLAGFLPEVSRYPDQDRVFSGEHCSVLSGSCSSGDVSLPWLRRGCGGAHSSGRPPPSPAGADPWARGSRRTSWGPFRSSSSTKPHCPSSPLQNGSRALSRPLRPPPHSGPGAAGLNREHFQLRGPFHHRNRGDKGKKKTSPPIPTQRPKKSYPVNPQAS
jgi:hypothetical protein